jgi:Major tropism determinant N-terminal domain
MSEQLQLRRGTYAAISGSFTPADGETVVDQTYKRLHVGDGATLGGWAAGREQRASVADAAYGVLGTDRIVAYTSITAARIVTLPAATAYPPGAQLTVIDESGSCSLTNTITVTAAGSDKINTNSASIPINTSYGFLTIESNGSNGWTVLSSQYAASSPFGASISWQTVEYLQNTGFTGGTITCGVSIPFGVILLSVGSRVISTVTGSLTSWNLGDASAQGDSSASTVRFGAANSTVVAAVNGGLVTPFPNVGVNTALLLNANGGTFSGGAIRLSIHYGKCLQSLA